MVPRITILTFGKLVKLLLSHPPSYKLPQGDCKAFALHNPIVKIKILTFDFFIWGFAEDVEHSERPAEDGERGYVVSLSAYTY